MKNAILALMIAVTVILNTNLAAAGGPVEFYNDRPGAAADMATTAYGLGTGVAAEANPLLAACGSPAAVVVCGLAGKYILEEAMVATGADPDTARRGTDVSGMAAAGANTATLALGVSTGAAAIIGIGAAIIYYDVRYASRDRQVKCRMDGNKIIVTMHPDAHKEKAVSKCKSQLGY